MDTVALATRAFGVTVPRHWRCWSHTAGALHRCVDRGMLQLIVGHSNGSGLVDSVTTARVCPVSVLSHLTCGVTCSSDIQRHRGRHVRARGAQEAQDDHGGGPTPEGPGARSDVRVQHQLVSVRALPCDSRRVIVRRVIVRRVIVRRVTVAV